MEIFTFATMGVLFGFLMVTVIILFRTEDKPKKAWTSVQWQGKKH